MKSWEYREIIRVIVKKALKKRYPELKIKPLNCVANTIAIAIHARMYGANVDGVESPLWRQDEPPIEAKELLNEENIGLDLSGG
jgi:hypothetical protein